MRKPIKRRPRLWLAILPVIASLSRAITVDSVPSPDLDFSITKRVGIAGDFSGISLYQYAEQSERLPSTNGSSNLMTQAPNGVFIDVVSADASIQAMCSFQGAIVVGGNFTSFGGKQSPGIAQFNPTDSTITPISGLSGQVNSLLCDDSAGLIYVGGNFEAADSTNAITWKASGSWASLSFAGFNGPVETITQASNGHVVFGGSFTGLGNASTPSQSQEQVINLSSATLDTSGGSTTTGFSNPKNIVCKTDGTDGAGDTWLMADDTPGTWQATFDFGFEPSKLRLWNTHEDGRGTKTWRFTALPNTGIMNFTYVDPTTGDTHTCTSECPLSNDTKVEYQDFHFVNQVGMNAFKIDVSEWYGSGGGFDGIELFEDNIFVYSINDFNEPACTNASFPSKATSTGDWDVTPSGVSNSEYLAAQLSSPITADSASVVFYPDIRESGNYTIQMYTPGCIEDETCTSRGQVNVTWTLTADGSSSGSKTLFQTNNFDKYDGLAVGNVDKCSDSFRPSVTLAPVAGTDSSNLTIVAHRVGFTLLNSTGGLNGLFEYDPSQTTVNTADFSDSTFDSLGATFSDGSAVSSLVTNGAVTYIGGNFTSDKVKNIIAIDSDHNSTVALDGGLNGEVSSMILRSGQLFVGGFFDNTQTGSVSGLSNVAVYDTSKNTWASLGAGVDGQVTNVVAVTLNISNTAEDAVTFTGEFKKLLAFDSNEEVEVPGFAVWVTSKNNWLQNLDGPVPMMSGLLSTSLLDFSNGSSLYAGSISSQVLSAQGAATVGNTLGSFPVNFDSQNSSSQSTTNSTVSKRATLLDSTNNISGIVTGTYDTSNSRNLTILAGHFAATSSNGSTINNLAIIDNANDNNVTGLPSGISESSVFFAVAVEGDTLFAGGLVNGTVGSSSVNGLIAYSLSSNNFPTQPPALSGGTGLVSDIRVRPKTGDVYVAGSFTSAGSLACPGVCLFSTTTSQWNRPGLGLSGVVSTMFWASNTLLVAGGNMTANGSAVYLATYDPTKTSWTMFPSAASLPGPVEAMAVLDAKASEVWVSGTSTNGSLYLMKYDGSSWVSAGITFESDSVITGLQMFQLTSSHSSSHLVDSNQALMITGTLDIQGFGNASGAIYNGTSLEPFALTSSTGTSPGSIARVFVENQSFLTSSNHHMAVGYVVLIGLAISLGLMLIIVVAGLALDRYRKKREGYVPAPTSMYDRGTGMQRIPPQELFESLSQGRPGAPQI